MLNCGLQMNANVEVPENLHEKCTLLRRVSHCGQVEIVRATVNRGADINFRDVNYNTVLQLAAESVSVDINLLLDNGMSVNLTNAHESKPLLVSAEVCHPEATKTLVIELLHYKN